MANISSYAVVPVSLALTLCAATSLADVDADKAMARNLFFDAVAAVDDGDQVKAADLFERSNALFPAPTAALGLARALTHTGSWVKAVETYHALARRAPVAGEPEAFARATEAAKAELEALEQRVPKLVISVTGADDAVVTIDGAVLSRAAYGIGRPVDPGTHKIVVVAPGFAKQVHEVVAPEGAVVPVPITLERTSATPDVGTKTAPPPPVLLPRTPPAAPPAPLPAAAPKEDDDAALRKTGWVLGGIGVAGRVGAAITGGLFLDADATAQSECQPGSPARCSQAGLDAVETGRTLGTVNAIMFVAGGIGVAGGAAFVIATSLGDTPVEAALRVGPGGFTVTLY